MSPEHHAFLARTREAHYPGAGDTGAASSRCMFQARYSGREWSDWSAVALCALAVFVTVPLASGIRDRVDASVGRSAFTYACIAVIAAVFLIGCLRLRRAGIRRSAYAWFAATAAAYAYYAWELRGIPEEAFHLLEYGLLGFLAFRALSHRVRDVTVYLTAALVGATVGFLDEGLQWLTPGRTWGFSDIGTNVCGASLVQIAIAGGVRPPFVRWQPAAIGIRIFCRWAIAALLLLAATLLNTPERIAWYTARVPALAFVRTNESVMFEYGYLYRDPDAGVFRSRLSPDVLRETDERRAAEAAEIIDAYPDTRYREFLRTYTPLSDPFVHEARVHLFSRDKHVSLTRDGRTPVAERGWHATVAWRENLILERYFGHTLVHSASRLSPADAVVLDTTRVPLDQLPASERESWVSRTLVTGIHEGDILAGLGFLLAALMIVERIATRVGRT